MSDQFESFGPPVTISTFEGSSLSASCWAPGGSGVVGAGNNEAFSFTGAGNNGAFSTLGSESIMAQTSGNNAAFTTRDGGNNSEFTGIGNNQLNLASLTQETLPVRGDAAPAVAPAVSPEVKPAAPEVQPAAPTDAKPAAPEHEPLKDGKQPVIKITDGNKAEEVAKADILVKADGSIERRGDALSGDKPHSEYRVAVEAGAPDEKVQEALADLKSGIESKGSFKPTLDVSEGLNDRVSERAKALFSKEEESEEEEGKGPPPGGGGGGGGGGPTPKPDGSEEDDKDQGKDGQNDGKDGGDGSDRHGPRAATKDDVRNAFATSEYSNMRGGSLGKYSENVGGWFSWFGGFTDEELAELGNPPDPKKLQALLKSDKFKKRMAERMKSMEEQGDSAGAQKLGEMFDKMSNDDKFAGDFCNFMNNQKQGKDATAEEMQQFFNPAMQEAFQSARVCDMASQMKLDLKSSSGVTEAQMKDLARNLVAGHVLSDAEKQDLQKTKPQTWQGMEAFADMVKGKFQTLLVAQNDSAKPKPRV